MRSQKLLSLDCRNRSKLWCALSLFDIGVGGVLIGHGFTLSHDAIVPEYGVLGFGGGSMVTCACLALLCDFVFVDFLLVDDDVYLSR
jgi:hypothetical protein